MAVNGGTAGFRCAIHRSELDELLETLEWEPFELGVFEVEWDGNKDFAIQDMRLERPTHRSIKLRIEENGEVLSALHSGDGILLTGALGSTGYNNSLGGPRIPLGDETVLLTPIAASQLEVFDSIKEVREVKGELKITPKYLTRLVLDGERVVELEPETEVVVRRIHKAFRFITRER